MEYPPSAYANGYQACRDKQSRKGNPFPAQSQSAKHWLSGWKDANADVKWIEARQAAAQSQVGKWWIH